MDINPPSRTHLLFFLRREAGGVVESVEGLPGNTSTPKVEAEDKKFKVIVCYIRSKKP